MSKPRLGKRIDRLNSQRLHERHKHAHNTEPCVIVGNWGIGHALFKSNGGTVALGRPKTVLTTSTGGCGLVYTQAS